jgi:hypothetical protein
MVKFFAALTKYEHRFIMPTYVSFNDSVFRYIQRRVVRQVVNSEVVVAYVRQSPGLFLKRKTKATTAASLYRPSLRVWAQDIPNARQEM